MAPQYLTDEKKQAAAAVAALVRRFDANKGAYTAAPTVPFPLTITTIYPII